MNVEFFKKYYQHGKLMTCMPVSLNRIGFILKDFPHNDEDEKELEELPTRLMVYLPEKNKVGDFGTVMWPDTIIDLFLSAKNDEWIVGDQHFQMNEVSRKTDWYTASSNEKGHLMKGFTIIGDNIYAYGMVRSVFKYSRKKQWDNITSAKSHPNLYVDINPREDTLVGDWVGFSALDGFNGDDIYAGGNKGDFWHYNGELWGRKDLPINSDISTIVCSPDGLVYIGNRLGSVLVGRNEEWSVIDESKEITHSTWFKGHIYFVTKNGRIYSHQKGETSLKEATFKTQYPRYMHHRIVGIASCDECLVVYTEIQAYAYDGENWHEIIEIPSLSKHT